MFLQRLRCYDHRDLTTNNVTGFHFVRSYLPRIALTL